MVDEDVWMMALAIVAAALSGEPMSVVALASIGLIAEMVYEWIPNKE